MLSLFCLHFPSIDQSRLAGFSYESWRTLLKFFENITALDRICAQWGPNTITPTRILQCSNARASRQSISCPIPQFHRRSRHQAQKGRWCPLRPLSAMLCPDDSFELLRYCSVCRPNVWCRNRMTESPGQLMERPRGEILYPLP